MKGTIKWYNARKGYGFILGEDNEDVFVHRSAIPPGTFLNEGDKVEYKIGDSEKGTTSNKHKEIVNILHLNNNFITCKRYRSFEKKII